MIEVEVKSHVDDLGALERRLKAMGARRVSEEEERDTYFGHPCRDFANTDEALRVRIAGGRIILTYKGPKLDKKSKSREEIIVELGGAQEAFLMLTRLGFRKAADVVKRRRVYKLGRCEVCLDRVRGIGAFVEIEAQVPKKGYERARTEVLALMEKLGGRRLERRSYLELLLSARDRALLKGS